ncbi:MAG: phosphonate metabolism transcriptional regulator PhnF [Pikeienuella sp.]
MTTETAPVWSQIREALAGEIAGGRYPPGGKLPSEADLAARFAVNRHTVRRALADLSAAGLVAARRGAGVFVTATPALRYPLGRRTRFMENLARGGREGSRRFLRLETLPANKAEAAALDIAPGEPVHLAVLLGGADGVPISYAESVFPARRFPDLPALLRETGSVTGALRRAGLEDYRRARTLVTAEPASGEVARHLRVAPQAPLLRTVARNVDPADVVVEHGMTWFVAERVELLIDAADFA